MWFSKNLQTLPPFFIKVIKRVKFFPNSKLKCGDTMGRKLHRKVPGKKKFVLPNIYECPRCESEALRIDLKTNPDGFSEADISCGRCHLARKYDNLKSMFEKIDIYGMFIDDFYENLADEDFDESQLEDIDPNAELHEIIQEKEAEVMNSDEGAEKQFSENKLPETVPEVKSALKSVETEPKTSSKIGFQIPKSKAEVNKEKKKDKKKEKKKEHKQFLDKIDDYANYDEDEDEAEEEDDDWVGEPEIDDYEDF